MGVTGVLEGSNQSQACVEGASGMHFGRVLTLKEAVLWHEGEGSEAREDFETLSTEEKSDLVIFLGSL